MFVNLKTVDISEWNWVPIPHELNLETQVINDTGHRIYERYCDDPNYKSEITDIVLQTKAGATLLYDCLEPRELYKFKKFAKKARIKKNTDIYAWENKIFSAHFHMKLHLRDERQNIIEQKAALKQMEMLRDICLLYTSPAHET